MPMSSSFVPTLDSRASDIAVDALRAAPETFCNPIAPGADPWVVWHEGYYYWCSSENDLGVAVYRSETLTARGEKVIVWRAPETGPHSREVWAPELHRLDDRWYIYVAASNGRNETHRMIVLEGTSDLPTGEFRFKSELYTGDNLIGGAPNRWAIDGTVLEVRGQRYMIWSGWADERDQQWLYVAEMLNPWTLSGSRVRLCANDDHLWERIDETSATRGLNEGPQILRRNDRVFVIYSASASWEVTYKLGMLELAPGSDPLDPAAWRKDPKPVLQATAQTWGVGHNCFVKSPDGSEDWIVYHAKLETTPNWNRAIHAQPFSWTDDDRPVFGAPIAAGWRLARPSGEVQAGPPLEVALGRAALAAAIGETPMVEGVRVVTVPESAR